MTAHGRCPACGAERDDLAESCGLAVDRDVFLCEPSCPVKRARRDQEDAAWQQAWRELPDADEYDPALFLRVVELLRGAKHRRVDRGGGEPLP